MQLNRRKFLLGGFAASAFVAGSGNAQVLTSGGKALTSSGVIVTVPPAPAAPSGSLLATQVTLTNPAGQPTQTNPFFSFGLPIARSEFPSSGYKLTLYNAAGSSKITDLQVDMTTKGWKPDLSYNYAVVTGYATGTTLTAGSTATFTVKAEAGSSPTTPVCTTATLAANSDIKAIVQIGTDTFTVSVNDIIANFSGALPSYPVGKVWQWKSGPYASEWCFGRYLKRNSDGANHKWAFLKLYVTALAASGPYIVRGYVENANSYGPHPSGTVGDSTTYSPQIEFNSIDIYNGTTLIGSVGGVNDQNSVSFAPSAVNLSSGEINAAFANSDSAPTGTQNFLFTGRCPIGFTSTGTLPAGLSPASTTTYWAVRNGQTNQIIPCINRYNATALTDGVFVRISPPSSGTVVPANRWIFANGGAYVSTTAGTSTGALPTGATFADNSSGGTLVWKLISAQITSPGTGTHTMVMKAACWGGSKAPIMGNDTYPFWNGAGTLPKLLVGYDRNYIFGKTCIFPPLDPDITCAPWASSRLPMYVQNMTYLPNAPGTYYIGNVAESQMDERVNQGSPTGMASVCLPTDEGLAKSCRLMALSWSDRNAMWRDERAQEIHIVNFGPDRLGASYPGMPPTNSSLLVGVSNTGSPKMFPFNGVWTGYGGTLGGSSPPDSGHSPNPYLWPAVTTGDPLFMDGLIESGAYQYACNGGGIQIRSAVFNGVHIACPFTLLTQTRSAGHAFQIFAQTEWVVPDAHPSKPYFSDIMDDGATFGPLWVAANVGPNGQARGYMPWLYPPGPSSLQGQETWMMSYLHMPFLGEMLKGNRPGYGSFYTSYFYKNLLPLWDSDVGGSEQLIDEQWDVIGNTNGGPVPPLDSQFLLSVADRQAGNPVIFKAFQVIPPPTKLFIKGLPSEQSSTTYTYWIPGSIGQVGSGNNAAFSGNAYGLTARAVCEMGAMAGFAYATKIADRIQAFCDTYYVGPDGKGNFCNWSSQATWGCTNGIMYAMKRQ